MRNKWPSAHPAHRKASIDADYDLYDDGSVRLKIPKLRGKAAVKAAKRARRKTA